MREVVAEFKKPVMLYSIGKDSSVMLHLAIKAFYPAPLPFPLLHVDTTWKFREMIAFRDETARRLDLDLIVHVNEDGVERGINPIRLGLVAAYPCDEDRSAEAGARQIRLRRRLRRRAARRGKEPRQGAHFLVPLARPRLGSAQPAAGTVEPVQHPDRGRANRSACFRCRIGPSSTSGTTSCCENIPVVPLYFAKERPVVRRERHLDHGR